MSSSIANTIPPKGVLKAAASPAAAPVTYMFRLEIFGYQSGSMSFTFLKMDAEIWMVGPSRPTAPPPNTITTLDAIFTRRIRNPSKPLILSVWLPFVCSMAATTCGMPLPAAKGAHFTTIHQAAKKQTGLTMNIAYLFQYMIWRVPSSAQENRLAYMTATVPEMSAAVQNGSAFNSCSFTLSLVKKSMRSRRKSRMRDILEDR